MSHMVGNPACLSGLLEGRGVHTVSLRVSKGSSVYDGCVHVASLSPVPLPKEATVVWVEGMCLGLCGSSWVSHGPRGRRPCMTHRQLFHCPKTVWARGGEMHAHRGSEPSSGSPALQAEGNRHRSLRRGSVPISLWKGRRWLCRGRALTTLQTPLLHPLWELPRGTSVFWVSCLCYLCVCLEMLIAFNINIRKASQESTAK